MINKEAVEILWEAIHQATNKQVANTEIQPEMKGLITRQQIAEAEVIRYLKSL